MRIKFLICHHRCDDNEFGIPLILYFGFVFVCMITGSLVHMGQLVRLVGIRLVGPAIVDKRVVSQGDHEKRFLCLLLLFLLFFFLVYFVFGRGYF